VRFNFLALGRWTDKARGITPLRPLRGRARPKDRAGILDSSRSGKWPMPFMMVRHDPGTAAATASLISSVQE
ncbi:MAG: hypothetical protein WBG13_23030, partial [Pseudolabrys sp.]